MKYLIYCLIGVIGLVVVLVVAGLMMPTEYQIERSVQIEAPSPQVHMYVGDLKQWPLWAPWEEDDPTIVTTLGETTTGVGASQTWTSESGDGRLEITSSDPTKGIAYDMAFIMETIEAPADCAMSYTTNGNLTTVTWTMEGDASEFMPPVLSGLMTPLMKSEIESMFDRGLEKLKTTVESADPMASKAALEAAMPAK